MGHLIRYPMGCSMGYPIKYSTKYMAVIILILLILALAFPAGAQDEGVGDLFDEYTQVEEENFVADPFAGFNRAMYQFNDKLYFWVYKPLATGYGRVVPRPVITGIDNMFKNLLFPVRFVNSLFQGKIEGAGSEVGIFLVNSTVGVLGFYQPAQDHFKLKNSKEDLGQTLGVCTIKEGFYLVLPVLGPSTFRDLVGLVGDGFITPLSYVTPFEASLGLKAFDSFNSISLKLGYYESLKQAAVDPYVSMKDAYIQLRRKRVSQ